MGLLRTAGARGVLVRCTALNLRGASVGRGVSGQRLQAVWAAGSAAIPDLPLAPTEDGDADVPLPVMSLGQEVLADFRSTGLPACTSGEPGAASTERDLLCD